MPALKKKQVERVDGVPYIYGSRKHTAALDRVIQRNVRIIQQGPFGSRFDANATAFLARDLTYVSQDVQRVLYEKLRAAEFVPVKSEVPRGADTWVYRQMDIKGKARVGAHLSADDAPNADVAYEEFPQPVTHVTQSYQYTIEDLERAAFAKLPLQRDKAEAAAELIARELDALMKFGDASQGITGFFNNPNVPIITLANGEWDSTATAAEIIADWAQIEQAGIDQGRDTHNFERLILPTVQEGRLRTLEKAPESDLTVGEYLLRNARTLKSFERWIALDDEVSPNVAVADPPQGIAYTPDPSFVFAEIPIPYEELPPQARGFGWVVNARATFAGVTFKRPLSAAYIENLD